MKVIKIKNNTLRKMPHRNEQFKANRFIGFPEDPGHLYIFEKHITNEQAVDWFLGEKAKHE